MAERDPPDPGAGDPGQVRPLIQWDDVFPTDQTPASGFSHSPPNTAEPVTAHNTIVWAQYLNLEYTIEFANITLPRSVSLNRVPSIFHCQPS